MTQLRLWMRPQSLQEVHALKYKQILHKSKIDWFDNSKSSSLWCIYEEIFCERAIYFHFHFGHLQHPRTDLCSKVNASHSILDLPRVLFLSCLVTQNAPLLTRSIRRSVIPESSPTLSYRSILQSDSRQIASCLTTTLMLRDFEM